MKLRSTSLDPPHIVLRTDKYNVFSSREEHMTIEA
jgi:hypothetical protein